MSKRQSLNAIVHIGILMRLLFLVLLFHSGMPFSTKDQDNDSKSYSCAVEYKGAWMYNGCHTFNLIGQYLRGPHDTFADEINWLAFRGQHYSLKHSEMKLRPQH